MTRTAIIAALPGELKPLVRGWTHTAGGDVELWRTQRDGAEWIAACAGAGAEAALRAWAAVERTEPIDRVISTGWAGALGTECVAGGVYRVAGVVDARTGERFSAGGCGGVWLVTSDRVAGREEKRRLAAAHGASLVDMEAAGVARIAAGRGIPFACLKGVSDGAGERLPDFGGFISAEGQFRLAAFLAHAAIRPWLWPALIRVGRASARSARRLRPALLGMLTEGAGPSPAGAPPAGRASTAPPPSGRPPAE
jgi:adenosylhomocysteine nucleosidase